MIHVVGGVYVERCDRPRWDQLFGSGGRAAAVLSGLSDDVLLTTCLGPDYLQTARDLAASFGYELRPVPSTETYQFRYVHNASMPTLAPYPPAVRDVPLVVEGDCVLRFGMLEAKAVVRGGRVVYDPQSPLDPEPYRENGSTADALAYVLNLKEGRRLTGRRSLNAVGRELLRGHRADVAVIKCGPSGGVVYTPEGATAYPAYQTPSVWPIGSGDVFSAVFAHFWSELSEPPEEAARKASAATAYYCASQSLPVPADAITSTFPSAPSRGAGSRPLVYLAGPFFNSGALRFIEELRFLLLEQDLSVFSPYHDVGLGPPDIVAAKDLQALHRAAVVLAVLDGLDPGTLFEIGYARARGLEVVALAESVPAVHLTMLHGSGCTVVGDPATALYLSAWRALGA